MRTRIIREDEAEIPHVKFTGVRFVTGVKKQDVDFKLCMRKKGGANPTVKIFLWRELSRHKDVGAYIEMEDCFPLEELRPLAAAGEMIAELGGWPSAAALNMLIANLASRLAKLEIKAVKKGIRFALAIGDGFLTEKTVNPKRVRNFLVITKRAEAMREYGHLDNIAIDI
jgi:hypothetical protein